jgi:hypothetical protein
MQARYRQLSLKIEPPRSNKCILIYTTDFHIQNPSTKSHCSPCHPVMIHWSECSLSLRMFIVLFECSLSNVHCFENLTVLHAIQSWSSDQNVPLSWKTSTFLIDCISSQSAFIEFSQWRSCKNRSAYALVRLWNIVWSILVDFRLLLNDVWPLNI